MVLPFEWFVNDCLTFTNNSWELIHQYKYAEDWIGQYKPTMRPATMRKKFGFKTLEDGLDSKLRRWPALVPPRGALVATKEIGDIRFLGASLGISVGQSAVFVSELGITHMPIESIYAAWTINV